MDIRKRSTPVSSNGALSEAQHDVESSLPSSDKAPLSSKRRRAKTFSLSLLWSSFIQEKKQLPKIVMMVCTVFGLYSISILGYYWGGLPLSNQNRTMDRVLHHSIPGYLTPHGPIVGRQYLPQRPRMIGYYFENTSTDSYLGIERMNSNMFRMKSNRAMNISPDYFEGQARLRRSQDYLDGKPDTFEHGSCVAQYSWQKQSFPTCNHLFEQDMTNFQGKNATVGVSKLGHGYWRDVWAVWGPHDKTVLKTLRYEHAYEERNYDRHRRDAVAMEQLTSSPWVMDIYGYCGNSGLFEYADGGSLDDSVFSDDEEDRWTSQEKLVVAYQVATAIAEVHNFHKEGVPAIVHTDITTSQFVYVSKAGIFKLNDFNRCRFIRWNKNRNQTCTFHVGNNPGTFRAPEEYLYEGETEKIDVYSMGNILYSLLTGLWPFESFEKSKKARDMVKKGYRPPISKEILETTDPFDKALLYATKMSWSQNVTRRATAREVQKYLEGRLEALGVPRTPELQSQH